jgi:hypothetical protein
VRRLHAAGICDCCDAPPEKEDCCSAQSWYRDHITDDGLYDERVWGDPFAMRGTLESICVECGGPLSEVRTRTWGVCPVHGIVRGTP